MKPLSPEAHAAFRLPQDLLAIIDEICIEHDLTRSQLFRRSVAEYIKARGYQRDVAERQSRRHDVGSAFLELIEAESDARKVSVSEFVRQSILANMHYMRGQAREVWSKHAL